jgi:septum formation protein
MNRIRTEKLPEIILASGSPRRKKMLKIIDIPFKIVVSGYEEKHDIHARPHAIVMGHARHKAEDVVARVKKGIVIGADTLVYRERKVYGKPKDLGEARKMLKELQGKKHAVYTGMAVCDTAKKRWETGYVRTTVTMRALTGAEIEHYFRLVNPLDKAGAYAIQDAGSLIIDRIEGCYYNVLGFPIAKLDEMLRKLGYTLFQRTG